MIPSCPSAVTPYMMDSTDAAGARARARWHGLTFTPCTAICRGSRWSDVQAGSPLGVFCDEGNRSVILERLLGQPSRAMDKRPAAEAYVSLVDAARQPGFYDTAGVPDTIDGRFELVVLHVFLLLDRLQWRAEPEQKAEDVRGPRNSGAESRDADFAQALFDYMFADMDHNLREMGVGDMSVGKRVRKMGEAFYGRALSYQAALDGGDAESLDEALRRNLFGTVAEPTTEAIRMMADYVVEARVLLRRQEAADIRAAVIRFPAPPGEASS